MQAEVHALLGLDRAPPSALRVLARHDDSQVLILHGDDRSVGPGERLASIDWFESEAVSQAVSRFCSDALARFGFPPDREGWHPYRVEHLPALLNLAKTNKNVTYFPPAPVAEQVHRQAWTDERKARLGFLAGRGYTAKAIAEDALVRSTEGAVFKQAQRLNVALSIVAPGQLTIRRLPASTVAAIDRGAQQAQLTREAFASRLLIAAAEDQHQLAEAG